MNPFWVAGYLKLSFSFIKSNSNIEKFANVWEKSQLTEKKNNNYESNEKKIQTINWTHIRTSYVWFMCVALYSSYVKLIKNVNSKLVRNNYLCVCFYIMLHKKKSSTYIAQWVIYDVGLGISTRCDFIVNYYWKCSTDISWIKKTHICFNTWLLGLAFASAKWK